MKPDDILKVAADYPFPKISTVELEDGDLNIEQLPQLISYLNPEKIIWRERAKIIGPDGTIITTEGRNDKVILVRTPLKKIQIGWDFVINPTQFKQLIQDLTNCKEGESYFNPSPWLRKDWINGKKVIMESGELSPIEELKFKEHELEIKNPPFTLDTNFYNPQFHYLNPFIINESDEINGKSEFFSLELSSSITLASSQKIELSKERTVLKVEGSSEVVVVRSNSWKEVKPYELVWNLRTPILRLDCRPPFKMTLYKLYPSGVIPFLFRYKDYEIIMGLVNLNETPIIANLILAARIISASILNGKGEEEEKLETEFDRVRIPIRKNGIVFIKLKIRKLLENFLRRKLVS